MGLSLKTLGVSSKSVSCWTVKEAPEQLRTLNLDGSGKLIWVVPDRFSSHIKINSKFSEKIRGATVYVS
jgi:hypothetical protein